ncbi:MAG: dihydropteroate synthase [Sphingomonadales bacterium]|nr:dihydropteroate synthase [Sphingomonadales bacterium]
MIQLYLRPCAYVDTPIGYDQPVERLAGGMLYFSAWEVLTTEGGRRTGKQLIPVSAFDTYHDSMSQDQRERLDGLRANILKPRPPLNMGERNIPLDQPRVMGILNCTPDSFSDGGKHGDAPAAIEMGGAMTAAGAAIIDIGGESTRPGAPLVWEGDEIARIEPVVRAMANSGAAVSVDSRKAAVMEAALAAGARLINDISALRYDDRAIAVALSSDCPIAIMHAPSASSDPHKNDAGYRDILIDIYDWFEDHIEALVAKGIARERLIVDPGLGFGKSLSDNLTLINNLALFHGLGCPILFGASRKRMIGALSNEAAADARLGGSLFLAMKAVEQGAHIVRVHDVPETVQAIHVWRGLRDAALTASV